MHADSFIYSCLPSYLQSLINHSAVRLSTPSRPPSHSPKLLPHSAQPSPNPSTSCSSSHRATNQHYSHSQAITSIFQSITTHSILPCPSWPSLCFSQPSLPLTGPFLASSYLLTATHSSSQPLTHSFFLLSLYIPILAALAAPPPRPRSASASPLLVTHRGGLSSSFLCFSLLLNLP